MTFKRGDIVRLKSNRSLGSYCVSEAMREYHANKRYIVLGIESPGCRFAVGPEPRSIERPTRYKVLMIDAVIECTQVALESDMIATGEFALETT